MRINNAYHRLIGLFLCPVPFSPGDKMIQGCRGGIIASSGMFNSGPNCTGTPRRGDAFSQGEGYRREGPTFIEKLLSANFPGDIQTESSGGEIKLQACIRQLAFSAGKRLKISLLGSVYVYRQFQVRFKICSCRKRGQDQLQ